MTRHLRTDRILGAWAITFALLLVISFALKITTLYSRVWALSWFVCTMSLLALGRLLLGRWIAHLAARGRFANRAVIVGIGPQAERLALHLERYDQVRTRILGLVDDADSPPDHSCQWPLLGGIDTLIELIRAGRVDQVFVALSWQKDERLRAVVQRLAVTPITIRLAPDLAAFTYAGHSLVQIAGLPMLHIFDRPISGWSWFLKTTSDYALATLFLIVLSPLMLIIALAIKLDSCGPILFRQYRVGFNDTPINVWKFRTMHATRADLVGPLVLVTRDDPRVTRVGRFLRRLSLDELPQLFNVLRGEMSIVGPRPHPLGARACDQLYEEAVERYAARHRVKPGITGWAQVNGWRGETDTFVKIQKRIEHDLYYIDNWSIWFDLLIVARTVAILLRDDRAY
jgi:Undecaprenyl-phosphate glucose phosphotransferase